MDKRARRRECFARINALSEREKASHSVAIAGLLKESDSFRNAGAVFAYIAMRSEPDLSILFAENLQKRWAFSRVSEDGQLVFHFINNRSDLRLGGFGIYEPDPERCPVAAPGDADLFLVPGVSFDIANGTRLGRGKGHYDRFLGSLTERPLLVGCCYSTQLSALGPEAHDIPMDAVVTESGWHMSAPAAD